MAHILPLRNFTFSVLLSRAQYNTRESCISIFNVPLITFHRPSSTGLRITSSVTQAFYCTQNIFFLTTCFGPKLTTTNASVNEHFDNKSGYIILITAIIINSNNIISSQFLMCHVLSSVTAHSRRIAPAYTGTGKICFQ